MKKVISRIYPTRLKNHMSRLLRYNGIYIDIDRFLGVITGTALGISCTIALIVSDLYNLPFITIFISVSTILMIAFYTRLVLRADKRGRFVDNILPDVLRLMSSNLRAGLSIDKSLLMTARPEFGYFQDEIWYTAGRVMSGESFENALKEMNSKIKSETLEATTDLIIQGIHSGGELAESLEKISDVLREREFTQKEINAGVQMYISFIMFAILFGSPLLFGISSFLIEMLSGISGTFTTQGVTTTAFTSSPMLLSVEFIKMFSVICLISTSIIGSMVIAIIRTGRWKGGIKYIPIFCSISVALFFIINKALVVMIGGMFS